MTAIAGGRIHGAALAWSLSDVVSIHARYCWRANHCSDQMPRGRWKFQSTPAIAGGRIAAPSKTIVTSGAFQSTPAIAGGRISGKPVTWLASSVFQSTPAIAGGRILASMPSW